ncbi:MAG: error-prone DNA polymerase [Sphingomonas sp.]|nr:error-prone DNA polymerase [Sphingomonas sp.]
MAASNYSFLRGASHPSDMVATALALGLSGIGIADRNTVAGTARAHLALREAREAAAEAGLPPLDFTLAVGARLVFADGTPDIVAYPVNRRGWGRLCRLLTVGNLRAQKGSCILWLDDLLGHAEDLLLIVMPETSVDPAQTVPLHHLRERYELAVDPPTNVVALRVEDRPSPPPPLVSSEVETREAEVVSLVARPSTSLDTNGGGVDRVVRRLKTVAPDRVWLAATFAFHGRDRRLLVRHKVRAERLGVPLIATTDALFADPSARPLHDILTCIRHGTTIAAAGKRLEANAERHLKSPAEIARLFADCPEAVAEADRLLAQVNFSLDQLRYEYPHEPVPEGWEAMAWLEHLALDAARARHPEGIPDRLRKMLDEEFALIRKCDYACYFLTVHDIVRFARSCDPPILCQGRGSAANSAVCFLLGITSVDPMQHDLLFSRFVSEERREPPDIDVDFEHERREEVMQYIYRRYGRDRAGIAATVIHYRPRSAVREVGKALGFTEDVTTRISSTVWGSYASAMEEKRFAETGFSLADPNIQRLKSLVDQLLNFPRHLSQHVGGFVLTQGRLDEMVPIHNAAMEDRTFIEWDKDDIDALGLMKVDVLALGMLTCIQKSFEMMRDHDLGDYELDSIPAEDVATYDMLCKGDSIGVFQVESRAQINMLPRLKPRKLYDLTVQVAIVRPGPIQGDMVHPYLRRRSGLEKVEFPSPAPPHDPNELRTLLGETYGVPLFQEQAMKLAIVAAAFTPGEANQLRRAMATFRHVGGMDKFREKLVGGMVARGYQQDFAERCYSQIEGFGSYGFPESHALSFARLVYVSSWIKCHQPAVFAAALLNSQPMGFYAPAQIVRDAREHGVEVKGIDVNASGWDNGLEACDPRGQSPSPFRAFGAPSLSRWERDSSSLSHREREGAHRASDGKGEGDFRPHALRLGFRQITGFRRDWAEAIASARLGGPFTGIEEIARRADLPQRALRLLADADGFASLKLDRRTALWDVRRTPTGELPLFAAARARELGSEGDYALPIMTDAEHVVADYQMTRLSLKSHPMSFLRADLAAEGIASCAQTSAAKNGQRIRTAGIVLVRQRPGNGNAIFITIEDETGVTNIVLWASRFERYRREVMASRLMLVEGEVQKSPEGVIHLMATRVIDRTTMLDTLSERGNTPVERSRADEFDHPPHPRSMSNRHRSGGGHPRDVRIIPKSRDFH